MQAQVHGQAAWSKQAWAGSPSIRTFCRAPGQPSAGRAGLLGRPLPVPARSPVVVRATATQEGQEYLKYLPSALNLAGAAFSAYCQPEGDKTTGKDQVFWFSDWPTGAVVTWPSSSAPSQVHCDARPKDELKTISEWQEQADLAREAVPTEAGAALKDLKPLAYVEVGRTDTQFWLYADLAERTIVVAFRGTSDDEDKITDARLLLVKGWKGTDANVWMHRGFKNGYVSARPLLHCLLDAVMSQDKQPWQIYCTGHSLGGALASLAAFDLALTTEWGDHAAPSVSLHTFGSPRVGNGRFRDLLTAKLKSSWRWANQGDPVTRVPFFVYRHARTKVELSPDGVLTEDVAEEKKNVGLLASLWEAVDDLIDDDDDEIPKGAVTQKTSEDQKTVPESDTDYNTVIRALNDVNRSESKSRAPAPVARAVATGAIPALSLGAVVAPHLQPAYFSNFKAAVAALKPQPTGPVAWAADKLSKLGKSLQGLGQGKKPQGPAGEVA